MEVQNVTSTDAINIQNVTSTDSATSSLISVSPVADNTTNATGSTTSSKIVSAVWEHKYKRNESCNEQSNGQTHLNFPILTKRQRIQNPNRKDLVDMIIRDELCFQFVEKAGFCKFLSTALPCFSMSADTVKRDVMKGYDERKNLIRSFLQNAEGRISLTCDVWTSLQQLGYLAITAHFLDEKWNLVSLLISFQLIPYPHTGTNIANCIKTVTDEYLITTKLQTITLDNASSNDAAIRELIDYASQDLITIKKELFHNRCLAHILNLIVKDGLKKISESIVKIRSCIKAIHTTPRRRQIFLDVCAYESVKAIILPLDCETRWNSTFIMLQLAIKMKGIIIRTKDRDKTFPDIPDEEEWRRAKILCTILKPFYECILKASATSYLTINNTLTSILSIRTYLFKMRFYLDDFVRDTYRPMIEKFNKYWENCNLLYMVACILDPRYKMQFISFYYREKEKQGIDNVDDKIHDI